MLNQTLAGSWITRIGLCSGLIGLLPAQVGGMDVYILSSENSSARTGEHGDLNSWKVDGQELLDQNSFYYRVGSSGADTSIDGLGSPKITQPDASTLLSLYSSRQFSIQVAYALTGDAAGSGASSLTEQITIQNLTGRTLDFHFFQYLEPDLAGTIRLEKDSQGFFDEAIATGADRTITESIGTSTSPAANHCAVGLPDLSRCGTPFPTRLTDCAGPSSAMNWTFEWDRKIQPNGALILESDFDVVPVPEPAAASLLLAGLICRALARGGRAA